MRDRHAQQRARGRAWASVEYAILGPLEARAEGRRVQLGGARQRAVLVCLLVRPNAMVPATRIVDEVWPEDPPATAVNLVQGYVSNLRKALGRAAIETDGAGYRIRVESLDPPPWALPDGSTPLTKNDVVHQTPIRLPVISFEPSACGADCVPLTWIVPACAAEASATAARTATSTTSAFRILNLLLRRVTASGSGPPLEERWSLAGTRVRRGARLAPPPGGSYGRSS